MTDKGYMVHITNTHNRWFWGKIRVLVILNYSILRELIDLALYYTVFGKPAVKRKMSTLPLTSRN